MVEDYIIWGGTASFFIIIYSDYQVEGAKRCQIVKNEKAIGCDAEFQSRTQYCTIREVSKRVQHDGRAFALGIEVESPE